MNRKGSFKIFTFKEKGKTRYGVAQFHNGSFLKDYGIKDSSTRAEAKKKLSKFLKG